MDRHSEWGSFTTAGFHHKLGAILVGLLVCVLCRCHAAQPRMNAAGRSWEAIERRNPLYYPASDQQRTATEPTELIPGMTLATKDGTWGVIDMAGGLVTLF
ncbi:MAG TPA: hypothetical protein VIV61_01545, partial [Candidatus Ozemobacteraceae bacterium]